MSLGGAGGRGEEREVGGESHLPLSILLSLAYFYFEVTKKFQNFSENNEEIFEGLIEPKLEGKAK